MTSCKIILNSQKISIECHFLKLTFSYSLEVQNAHILFRNSILMSNPYDKNDNAYSENHT